MATVQVVKSVLPVNAQSKIGVHYQYWFGGRFCGCSGWSVYSATKPAVAAFSEVIALDVKESESGLR
jgi:hypothetical protein